MPFITPTQARERVESNVPEQVAALLKSIETFVVNPTEGFTSPSAIIRYYLNEMPIKEVLTKVVAEIEASGWEVNIVDGMGRAVMELRKKRT